MDKGYDAVRVYTECEERGCDPVIPMKGVKGKQVVLPIATGGRLFPRIARHSERFRDLYRGRAAVEREFGRLKHEYGLGPLRVDDWIAYSFTPTSRRLHGSDSRFIVSK